MDEFKIPKLYTVKETAALMKKSSSYVYEIIYAGLLKAKLRRGTTRGYVITKEAILDFYENAFCERSEINADK